MSVDLYRDDKDAVFFSNAGWRLVIAFAEHHRLVWNDNSDVCSAECGVALAHAIENGLEGKSQIEIGAELTAILGIPINFDHALEDEWRELIAFARRGEFQIFV